MAVTAGKTTFFFFLANFLRKCWCCSRNRWPASLLSYRPLLTGTQSRYRWLKFEEDVEDGGERWSKPYVATLSLHSLFELRNCIFNGTVLLDMRANTIEEIAGEVSRELLTSLDGNMRPLTCFLDASILFYWHRFHPCNLPCFCFRHGPGPPGDVLTAWKRGEKEGARDIAETASSPEPKEAGESPADCALHRRHGSPGLRAPPGQVWWGDQRHWLHLSSASTPKSHLGASDRFRMTSEETRCI